MSVMAWRERNLLLGVTHELKTPLASVQLGLDSLRRLNLAEQDENQVLNNMQSGVRDLGNLIEDMLVATRLQRKESIHHDTFSWSNMVHECVARFGDDQGQRIQVHLDDHAPMEVSGDKALWVLATSNLLENALKYSQGQVSVHVHGNGQDAIMKFTTRDRGFHRHEAACGGAHFVRLNEEVQGRGWDCIWFRRRHNCTGLLWKWKPASHGVFGACDLAPNALKQALTLSRENRTHHLGRLGSRQRR